MPFNAGMKRHSNGEQSLHQTRPRFAGLIRLESSEVKSSIVGCGRAARSQAERKPAARDGFRRGDKARFLIFVSVPGDYSNAVATSAFSIDEQLSSPDGIFG